MFFIYMKYALEVTSESNCISITLQRVKLEALKAITPESLFISETPEIAIRNQ